MIYRYQTGIRPMKSVGARGTKQLDQLFFLRTLDFDELLSVFLNLLLILIILLHISYYVLDSSLQKYILDSIMLKHALLPMWEQFGALTCRINDV